MQISPNKLRDDLKTIQKKISSGPVLLHTDLLQIGLVADPSNRTQFCMTYEAILDEVFGQQGYLIPTFNYDYCRTAVYDVVETPSEVGALTDYYRRNYPGCRTRTPIFHFCIRHHRGFTLETHTNCFDDQSTFGELVRAGGAVLFLGAPLNANTFVHHVEELSKVPYRFHKTFSGTVVWGQTSYPTQLTYRVRPMDGSVQYRWDRIEAQLLDKQIVHSFPAGRGRALFFTASKLQAYWLRQLQADPRALISE